MLKRIFTGAIAGTLSAALLAGCGGGGGSQAVPSTPGGSKTSSVSFKVFVPGRSSAIKNGKRLPLYTSRSTKGIGVEYQATSPTTYTGAPSSTSVTGAPISATSPGCSAGAATDGSFTCTIYVPGVPVGYNDFRVTLWDTAPTGTNCGVLPNTCSFAVGAHALSINVLTNQVVLAGIVNPFNFTLLPVVASIYVQLPSGIVDGAPSSVTGYLVEKDAQGNIILGTDQFVNDFYETQTYGVQITNDLGPGGCNQFNSGTKCSLYFSTAAATPTFTSAGASGNSFTLNYDGTQQFPSTGALQPIVSTSDASSGTHIDTALSTGKIQVTQSSNGLTVPGQPQVANVATFGSAPAGLTYGSDGNFWLSGGGGITRVTPLGAQTGYGAGQGLVGTAGMVATGSEGYVWYTDTTNQKIARFAPVNPNVTVTETLALPSGSNLTGGNIVQGPDGNAWFTDAGNNRLGMADPNAWSAAWVVSSSGNLHALPGAPVALASGPTLNVAPLHQSVCAVVNTPNQVACWDIQGASFASQNLAAAGSSVVTGPDNNVYVGEVGKIQVFPVSGGTVGAASASYALANAAATVKSMTVSADGNIWFVENGTATPTFGSLDIQSATPVLTEFSANTGIASGTVPFALILGPSPANKLYFTDSGANKALDTITP